MLYRALIATTLLPDVLCAIVFCNSASGSVTNFTDGGELRLTSDLAEEPDPVPQCLALSSASAFRNRSSAALPSAEHWIGFFARFASVVGPGSKLHPSRRVLGGGWTHGDFPHLSAPHRGLLPISPDSHRG